MINTVLIDYESRELDSLKAKIDKCCPLLQVNGTAQTFDAAKSLFQIEAPELAFVNPEIPFHELINKGREISSKTRMEIIFVSNSSAYAIKAVQLQIAGYLFRPLDDNDLVTTVAKATERIQYNEEAKRKNLLLEKLLGEKRSNELIGIPTIEGYEFISANEIIRCEGLQKCTRVVTVTKTDIISSYNIGEFVRLLKPYHFFSPHKSHLINLDYIRKYLREGTIVLKDNSCVPISKRRKIEFLNQVVHL